MRLFLAILGCALVSGCAPYYATVVNVDSGGASAAAAGGQPGGQASLTEGSAFEVKSDNVRGAIIIERAALTTGKDALFNAAQRRVAKLGPYDIGAAEYTHSYNPKSQKLSQLVIGLLLGRSPLDPLTPRRQYIVCFEHPLAGETDQGVGSNEEDLYVSIIRYYLTRNGYYPALVRPTGAAGTEDIDRLRRACPPIAGYYLGTSFTALGGLQHIVDSSKNETAELHLIDLETGQMVWRKDVVYGTSYGSGANLLPNFALFAGARADALMDAFSLFSPDPPFPPYNKKDGPAEM